MAEVVGVAGSSINIISAGIQTTRGILWYYDAWKTRDEDVLGMYKSLGQLERTLELLLENISPPAIFRSDVKDHVEKNINALGETLKKLAEELEKVKEEDPPGMSSKLQGHMRKALYPFKMARLAKIQLAIAEARSNLDLALTALKLNMRSMFRQQMEAIRQEKQTQKILDWLSLLNPWKKHFDICEQRQTGTGQWLLDDPNFLEWVKGSKKIIWCRGIPGVGKTVLVSAVIDFLEKDLPIPDVGLAIIYCNYKENLSQTVESLIATIARQLVEQKPTLGEELHRLYEKHSGRQRKPSFHDYLGLLKSVTNAFSEVYIVIDALDECLDKHGEHIWNRLPNQLKFAVPNIHLFCTSRDIRDTGESLTGSTCIRIQADEAIIKAYILAQIEGKKEWPIYRLCKNEATLKGEILRTVLLKAKGMFLAANLHLQSLAQKKNVRAVRKALSELPERLDGIYDETMERIRTSNGDSRLAHRLLSWVVYAARPPGVLEIQHAIAVHELEPEDTVISEDLITPQDFLVNACAGLIEIDESSNMVRLIHYTTQDYFERNGSKHFPHSQWDIAETCLRYLSLDVFEGGACQDDIAYEHRLKENPLLEYAATNWGNHIRGEMDQAIQNLALKFLLDESKVSCSVQVLFVQQYPAYLRSHDRFPTNFQSGHYIAYLGLETLMMKLLLKNRHIALSRDGYGRTPLWCASRNGHEAVVKLLLQSFIPTDVDSRDNYGETPLSKASKYGHESVVSLLLEKGADLDSEGRDGRTPLSLASEHGHQEVVKLLLNMVAKVDSKDNYGQTPLSWASENGRAAVVDLLLKKGVDMNSKNNPTQNSLSLKLKRRNEAMVKDVFQNSEFSWQASEDAYERMMELLKSRIDSNFHGKFDQVTRSFNFTSEREELNFHLEASVQIESQYGQTPLSKASEYGHEAVVKLLLKTAVDLETIDEFGRTPLSLASENGREVVVNLLLEKGVNADSKDKFGRTPLSWASQNGHEAVVNLLLEKNVDADSEDVHGQTPLAWASKNGREAVINLLLQKNVNVESKNTLYQTPLSKACENGHKAVVEILLKWGSKLDSKDSFDQTPLSLASKNGHDAITKLLVVIAVTPSDPLCYSIYPSRHGRYSSDYSHFS